MHIFITSSLFALTAALLMTGCGSTASPPATMQATAPAGGKAWVMQSGGANVLKLTTTADVKGVAREGSLHFNAPQYEIEFWLVSGAKSVDDAVAQVSTRIVDEFKDFKPEHTTDLTIAGAPAKQLVGAGHEADDGDPGDADVIVFKVGDKIFIGCNHGESLTPSGQEGLMTVTQTAQMP
jgi:hypothetical protein